MFVWEIKDRMISAEILRVFVREREREREPRLDSMGNGCFSYFSYDCKIASPLIDIYLVHFGFAEIRA